MDLRIGRAFGRILAVGWVLAAARLLAQPSDAEWKAIGFAAQSVNVVAADPLFPSTLYAASGPAIFRTIDGGSTWEEIDSGIPGQDSVRSLGSTSVAVFAGKPGRVYRRLDGGREWELQRVGASSPRDASSFAVGDYATWFTAAAAGLGEWIECAEFTGNSSCTRLYRGTSDGRANGRARLLRSAPTSLAVAPGSPDAVYAGFSGSIWKSGSGYESVRGVVTVIAPVPLAAYAVAWDAGAARVLRTGPGGWVDAGPGLPERILALAVHPAAPASVYAGTSDGVYLSTDAGQTWSRVGLSGLAVPSLAFAPNDPSRIYAATGAGLFVGHSNAPASACEPSAVAECLDGGRFRVEASWRTDDGRAGRAWVDRLTPDTASFWFFDPNNVELVVKVLDGTSVNGHHWVFTGSLSTVQYEVTVTDTRTGAVRHYVNPPGRLSSLADAAAFAETGRPTPLAKAASFEDLVASTVYLGPVAACAEGPTTLCLNDGRFRVDVAWEAPDGRHGSGQAVRLTADTGDFWFFNEANVELVVKVLDGRPVNGRFWVFSGALSNVAYTITVTDTQTGIVKTYANPQGNLASFADTEAF